jgi:hypothetical protein
MTGPDAPAPQRPAPDQLGPYEQPLLPIIGRALVRALPALVGVLVVAGLTLVITGAWNQWGEDVGLLALGFALVYLGRELDAGLADAP